MLMLRLSPLIPFNVNNYILGTVKVNYFTFMWVMIVGTLPITILLVSLGSLGRRLDEINTAEIMILTFGILATGLFLNRVLQARTKLLTKSSRP
jgi:uncharacterized membrane protein YdjX (TVP38/TMEM64 family)